MASGGWNQKGKRKCRKSLSDAVEGTPVDLDGQCRHEQVEEKLMRRGK